MPKFLSAIAFMVEVATDDCEARLESEELLATATG